MSKVELAYYQSLPYTTVTAPIYNDKGLLSCWRATIEEVEGCMAHGETEHEALDNLNEAFETYILGMYHFGREDEIVLPNKTPQPIETVKGLLSPFIYGVNIRSESGPIPIVTEDTPLISMAEDTSDNTHIHRLAKVP